MNHAIAILGTERDSRGFNDKRWEHWRPTIALCSQADLPLKELLLLVPEHAADRLVEITLQDIQVVSPQTKVIVFPLNMGSDPWDHRFAYDGLSGIAETLDPDIRYLVSLSTGTHPQQFALTSLVMNGTINGQCVQCIPPTKAERADGKMSGRIQLVDFREAKYDRLIARLAGKGVTAAEILKKGIQTQSPTYNALITQIEKVATRSRAPMLIMGETGAGKTQLAAQLHALKLQQEQCGPQFVMVNCATLNGNSEGAKSALFGHVKGAYTGATTSRTGFLFEANGGVLFLDEIGTLGLEEQGMLLHALETGSFNPLGSNKAVHADFQLICGTNLDLRQAVLDGTFRADLLSRINVWSFTLPALRDRREDIAPNIEFELAKHSQQQKTRIRFNKEAQEKYLSFALSPLATWTGNFRDLSSSITRMVTLCENGRIDLANVMQEIDRLKLDWHTEGDVLAQEAQSAPSCLTTERWAQMCMVERVEFDCVLSACLSTTTQKEAAEHLYSTESWDGGTNPSGRLSNYLRRYGLTYKDIQACHQ
jgi:transcriptional regulatory protein RtcR